MNQIVKRLIQQWVFYGISVLIFQSFITFYIIKYFDWIQWAIVGNIVLYVAVACWYITMARINHHKSISVKSWMYFAIVMCLLSTCMMQRWSMSLLLLWYVLLWFWKWVYFCSLYLYEFKHVVPAVRTKYAAIQSTWKSGAEIIIPLILWYFFSVIPLVQSVYLIIFLASAVMLVITAISIYKLPEFMIQPLEHSHYVSIFKRTSWVAITYIMLSWLVVFIPFIWTLLEVQILEHESWAWLFQWVTKWVTLLILLIIIRFSHITHPTRYFMVLALLLWISLLIMPWWGGWIVLILYVLSRSLLLTLFTMYEKPLWMKVMESMSSENHSMLPVIIVQEILHTTMRIIVLSLAYLIFVHYWVIPLTYGIVILSWIWFIAIAWLVFYYLYERAHGRDIKNN